MNNAIFDNKEWQISDLIKYYQNYLQENGFSNPKNWSVGRLLKGNLLDRVNKMTPMQKMQLDIRTR